MLNDVHFAVGELKPSFCAPEQAHQGAAHFFQQNENLGTSRIICVRETDRQDKNLCATVGNNVLDLELVQIRGVDCGLHQSGDFRTDLQYRMRDNSGRHCTLLQPVDQPTQL